MVISITSAPIQRQEFNMSRHLNIFMIQIAFALAVIVGGGVRAEAASPVVVAQAASFDAQKAKYNKLMSERAKLEKSLAELEVQYGALAKNIDKVKRKGVSTLNRAEIQKMLRKGRKLAQRLSKVQRDIMSVDAQLQKTAQQLVATINRQMKTIERQLSTQTGSTRKKSIATLNTLSKQRATYSRPLPQVDHKKIKAMLSMAEGLDNPDDMIALADELQDAEEGVRKKLNWITRRLKELKARKRLLRRAQAFSKQERFFEESARGRQVGRVATRRVRTSSDKKTPTNNVAPPRDQTESDPDAAPSLGSDDQNFSADAPARQPTTEQAPVTPSTPTTSDDPFTSTKETVIISKEADPATVAAGRSKSRGGTLDKRIKTLERDRKLLKRQADALGKKAKSLRKQANSLE